ncbi:MAG: helix-turn-helix domain-containing protein, partial [Chitinophagales bacterium]
FSEFSKIHLNWLKIILSVMGVLCLLWGMDVFLRDVLGIYQMHNFSEIIMGIAVLLLAFGSIRQNSIANVEFKEPKAPPIEAKTEKANVDASLLQKIKERMKVHQDFLNPTLTLKEFAKNLHEPSRNVSMHINQGLEMSFVDFVNQYRVTAVKQQIAEGALENFTLLAIALESGFNSKSTFNRVFKKSTGMSPSEYLKSRKTE